MIFDYGTNRIEDVSWRLARALYRSRRMQLHFDRGTVLILEPPNTFAVADLPGVLWDSRVRAYRCPAFQHARLRAALDAAAVRYTDNCPAAGQNPPQHEVALRPYQEAALAAWELASRRGIIVLPTGSGKTRVALAAVGRCAAPTLILVPTRVLLEQWSRSVQETLGVGAGRYGDGVHTLAPVTVATFESAWRYMAGLGNRFQVLIVDEAHHFGAALKDEALEMSLAPFRLGLTATPPRGPAAERLALLLGPVVFEQTVSQLTGEFLAPYDSVVLPVELDAAERVRYDRLDACFREQHAQFRWLRPDASWEDFTRDAMRSAEGRQALEAWREARRLLGFPRAKQRLVEMLLARHHGDRVLVFTGDNHTAYQIARQHLVMPLTCDIGRKERECALTRFRNGELRALVSSQVLNEGLDVPEAEIGVVVAGQGGEREHVQRLGRLLRPRPGKRALVYELVAAGTREVRTSQRRRRALAS
jgi:superfamily II DNA or RNA helicase